MHTLYKATLYEIGKPIYPALQLVLASVEENEYYCIYLWKNVEYCISWLDRQWTEYKK